MTSSVDVATEQLCYIPCNFCSIVLAVSVPSSSLFDIVTVRCGHCTNLWSVNMAAALQSLSWQDVQAQNCNYYSQNYRIDSGSSSKCNKKNATRDPTSDHVTEERSVNRPPEKRQRVPSAYNQFIKEEIQRIKANNPDISHREAFSTAAKNWAHFPRIHFGLMLETNNQAKLNNIYNDDDNDGESNGFDGGGGGANKRVWWFGCMGNNGGRGSNNNDDGCDCGCGGNGGGCVYGGGGEGGIGGNNGSDSRGCSGDSCGCSGGSGGGNGNGCRCKRLGLQW